MDKYPMTQKGYDALEKELQHLIKTERPNVIAAIATAREHGDLSENAEYHAAREQQGFIEARIKELEAVTSKAQVIDLSTLNGNTVKFGATVEIVDEETDEEETYTIVGQYEADADKKRISITAPIARALIAKSVGESVTIRTPGGVKTYEILSVTFSE